MEQSQNEEGLGKKHQPEVQAARSQRDEETGALEESLQDQENVGENESAFQCWNNYGPDGTTAEVRAAREKQESSTESRD